MFKGNVTTAHKQNTLRISQKLKEIRIEKDFIQPLEAWKFITNLNRCKVVCYTPEEVIKTYLTLKNHKMIKGILKIKPRFKTAQKDINIIFDYFS